MSEPTIEDAKALAFKHRKTGVLILHVGTEKFGVASYGMTRKQCDAMRKIADQIFDMVQSGEIRLPDTLILDAPVPQ